MNIMALYHLYRPQKFSDVVAQEHIIKTITNQIATEKVAHAYLFSGSRGTGKTTTARLLAKALNCQNRKGKDFEPCNTCSSCEEISSARSIDVIEIDAASHTGVDNVRENIIDSAQFRPSNSKYKIFIIDEAHMLSTAAFNALLKTLEEPPEYVIFILATTEMHKLPETIISRCQRFDFHKLDFAQSKKFLEKIAKEEGIKIDREVIERIIIKSEGAARDAISLLDQLISTGEKNIDSKIASLVLPITSTEKSLEMLEYLVNKDVKNSITLLNNLVESGINLLQYSHEIIELLHLCLIYKANKQITASNLNLDEKTIKEIRKIAEQINDLEIINLLDILISRRQQIKNAPLPQLPLEMGIFAWCQNNMTHETNSMNPGTDNKKQITDNIKKDTFDTEPIKKTISERVTEKVKELVNKTVLSKEDALEHWPKFLQAVEKQFPSLSFILKMAEFKETKNNNFIIAVGYSFHREKIMEKNCQHNLEEILENIYQTKIHLEPIVVENNNLNATADNELIDLASSIGGEIVN
ncbi:MAG: polymerase III, subunit gamma and tau protein [Candidatus Magasanikbacteria bacterium GW2011_GWC2_37_14]|uniref:DNA polymerase III subunit gamma/tau n=1 Tax=Candidatus Magasanikbacteria bacterium GW2011_GWC2_37_14 TaxID=1619046 RepID=A0A0G0JH60_9BACT|nr:MAG: polymerase III, subunit gamma and tau protein [Candidatus Magasanikbacteria bacterium GW2011_GWC2_37_14]